MKKVTIIVENVPPELFEQIWRVANDIYEAKTPTEPETMTFDMQNISTQLRHRVTDMLSKAAGTHIITENEKA